MKICGVLGDGYYRHHDGIRWTHRDALRRGARFSRNTFSLGKGYLASLKDFLEIRRGQIPHQLRAWCPKVKDDVVLSRNM